MDHRGQERSNPVDRWSGRFPQSWASNDDDDAVQPYVAKLRGCLRSHAKRSVLR